MQQLHYEMFKNYKYYFNIVITKQNSTKLFIKINVLLFL